MRDHAVATIGENPHRRWVPLLLVVLPVLTVIIPSWFGLLSLPAMALLGLVALAAAGGLLVLAPQALVALAPALLPSPMFADTYAWELALVSLLALTVVYGWRRRAGWFFRLSSLELLVLAFTLWGVLSGFWSPDLRHYLTGVRRLLLGFVSLWLALRLPHIARRGWFELGLFAGSCTIALAALGRWLTTGYSAQQSIMHRPGATALGWGTANYIATLLLLFAPIMVAAAVHEHGPRRLMGWIASGLTGALQMIIASRAAGVLFVLATGVQLLLTTTRRARIAAVGALAGLALLVMSPLGQTALTRFTSLRELGSMTLRIWYQREGWRRMIEHLPFGMGLDQGYANPDKLQGIDPHNYWLVVGGDMGIPGLVLWIAILVMMWRALARLIHSPSTRIVGQALLITLIAGQLHTLVEPTFQGVHYQFVFYWSIGGYLAYSREGGEAPAAAASSER